MLVYPKIFANLPVISAQSTRQGGVSEAPFQSLNLGLRVSDNEKAVLKNRELFCTSLGVKTSQLSISRQIHEDRILVVDAPLSADGYDALITHTPGIFIAVFIADCTPVLIYDPVKKVCAAIHAGWKGTVKQIAYKTLQRMQDEFGTQAGDCLAYIGTCIGFESFEVNADVADHFSENEKRYDPSLRKFFVDLKTANKNQLLAFGLAEKNIEVSDHCTVLQNKLFFSHRKEKGLTGRMMAVVGMKEAC